MKLIMQRVEANLITIEEANLELLSYGYELRDNYKKGEYFLYPLYDNGSITTL